MTTTTAEPSGVPAGEEKGLKANAIGFVDALVIQVSETPVLVVPFSRAGMP